MQCGLPAARCFTSAAVPLCLFAAVISQPARAQNAIVLNGASQYGENHTITRTLTPIEQKVNGRWSRGDVARVTLTIDAQSDMGWVVGLSAVTLIALA